MTVVEMYYYFFYKIYSLMEYFKKNDIGNKFRAIIFMTFIESWILFSIYNYLDAILNQHNTIEFWSVRMIPFLVILLLKWFAFIKDDAWKSYVQKFNDLPPEKNSNGTFIVTSIVVFIFANLVVSCYLQ